MKIKAIDGNTLLFDNGAALWSEHETDCCEAHWAAIDEIDLDAEYISIESPVWTTVREMDFPEEASNLIRPVEGIGFFLVSTLGHKVLVNCYADNNGYYSTDLTLVYCHKAKRKLGYNGEWYYIPVGVSVNIDLTSCQEWVDEIERPEDYLREEIGNYDSLLYDERETRYGFFGGVWCESTPINYEDVIRENEAWEEDRFNFPDMEFPVKDRETRSRRRKNRAHKVNHRKATFAEVTGGEPEKPGKLAKGKGITHLPRGWKWRMDTPSMSQYRAETAAREAMADYAAQSAADAHAAAEEVAAEEKRRLYHRVYVEEKVARANTPLEMLEACHELSILRAEYYSQCDYVWEYYNKGYMRLLKKMEKMA